MNYSYTQKVLFQHCDPAGIVFYPRYFEMLNACVESWFETQLNCSFAKMHSELGKGVPTVTVEAEFLVPSRLGEVLDFSLSVVRIGRSSLDLSVTVLCADQVRINFTNRLVFLDSVTATSEAWPESTVALLKNFLSPELGAN